MTPPHITSVEQTPSLHLMQPYFDLTIGNVDEITIYKSNNGDTCYIADKKNKTIFYPGFILNNKATVQTICDVGFYPSSISGKFIPRLTFKVIYKKTGDVKEVGKGKDYVRISFATLEDGYEYFWKMIGFLHKFKDLVDLGNFDRSYKVVDSDAFILDFKDQEQSKKIAQLSKIVSEGNLSAEDLRLALQPARKQTVTQFFELLHTRKFDEYRVRYLSEITQIGEEAVWHHFLKQNLWIIGLGVDIRFIRDLISQANVGVQDTDGSGSPRSDFLGITDYTLLVELKTASTDIFTKSKQSTARANTWSFTQEFIDGISQCLGQKSDWDKTHIQKGLVGNDGKTIDQRKTRTVDPKTIFIIGNKIREFSENETTPDIECKRDTFERFRRNNRNIDIVTFDELYEKAYYIVYGKKPSYTIPQENSSSSQNIDTEDLPF